MLSGSALALGLPALGAMMNTNGTAFGQTTPIPRRYGVFFFAGGVQSDWTPNTPGALSILQGQFAPLQRHLSSLTMVGGLDCPSFGDYNTNRHIMGTAGGLSGMRPSNGAFTGKSFDQVIAEALPQAPRRSLEVGIHPEGTAEQGTGWDNISHSGANNPNPAEFDPKAVFSSLFGDVSLPTPGPTAIDEAPLRKSYLDAVMADARALQAKLGSADRAKLEAFLDGLREIEADLQSPGPGMGGGLSCAVPEAPGDARGDGRVETNRSMSKLVAATLACGLTHVFTYQYTLPNAFIEFPGMNDSHHNLGHVPQQSQIGASTAFIMERYAELLDALAAYSEGAGTLLDNCAVLVQSDTSWDHNLDNMLCIVGGKAGGALGGGRYVNTSGPISRAAFTLGKACGANLTSLGNDDGETSEAINDILA
jgi:hypothetical protein